MPDKERVIKQISIFGLFTEQEALEMERQIQKVVAEKSITYSVIQAIYIDLMPV